MIKKVGITLTVLVALAFGGSFLLPADYTASRTTEIAVPAPYIYEFLITQRNHEIFSPWKAEDQTLKMTYNEIRSGVGSAYSWTSENSGTGTSTIKSLKPNEAIRADLVFDGMGESEGWWRLHAQGDKTTVTWGFDGQASGMMERYMGLMMDSFVGPQFESGLALLKAHIEPEYTKSKSM